MGQYISRPNTLRKFERYSAANIMKLKFLKVDDGVSILAIIIGLEKDKNKALILSHNIDEVGGKLAVEEIIFEPNVPVNGEDYLSKLRNKNESCSINSRFNAETIELTFLTDKDFDSLYEKMPKYVDFYRYDEWYSIFYDDDFTPDFSTYYIVRNTMLDWDLKLWEEADEFFKKYPKAVAYGTMPNVNLDVPQEDCIPESKKYNSKIKKFIYDYGSDYKNNFLKNKEKWPDTLKSTTDKIAKNFLLIDIEGIEPVNEQKLDNKEITVSKLFENYIAIIREEDADYKTAKSSFILYLENNGITKNHGSMIFKHINDIFRLYKTDFRPYISKLAVNTLEAWIKDETTNFSLKDIQDIDPTNEEKLDTKGVTASQLFEKYITIIRENNYNALASQSSFLSYLKENGITRNFGVKIFYYMVAIERYIKTQLVQKCFYLFTDKEGKHGHTINPKIYIKTEVIIDVNENYIDLFNRIFCDNKNSTDVYLDCKYWFDFNETRAPLSHTNILSIHAKILETFETIPF